MPETAYIQFGTKDTLSFDTDEFKDIHALKEYLHRAKDAKETEDTRLFDLFKKMVTELSQLRFQAEDDHKDNPHQAFNSQKELPISRETLTRILLGENDGSPDQRIITRIAQNELGLVESLLEQMRKVLQRRREMVSIGNAQQLDAHCLRWLTYQPGRNAVEKAGLRQQILAIVRDESINTLENRVLKDFIGYCQRASWDYIKEFGKSFKNSQRIHAVQILLAECKRFLGREDIQALPILAGMPYPNYVLQYDKRYSRMWERYQQLVQQTRMVELVWPFRHRVFFEYTMATLACIIEKIFREKLEPFFSSDLWLRAFPENGLFLNNATWSNIYIDKFNFFMPRLIFTAGELSYGERNASVDDFSIQFQSSSVLIRGKFLYIPKNSEVLLPPETRSGNNLCIIFLESKDTKIQFSGNITLIILYPAENIKKMLESKLRAYIKEVISHAH